MSRKFLTRLLSFILSAGMVISPVTAYAAEPVLGEGEDPVLIEDAGDEDAAEEIVIEDNDLDAIDGYEIEEEEVEAEPATADAVEDAALQDDLPPFYAWINGNKLYWQKVDGAAMYRIEVDGITFGVYYSPADLDVEFSSHYVNSGYHTFKFYAANDWRLPITQTVTLSYNYTSPHTYIREVSATSDMAFWVDAYMRHTLSYSNISRPEVGIEFREWTMSRPDTWNCPVDERYFTPGTWVGKLQVFIKPEYKETDLALAHNFKLTVDNTEYEMTGKETKDGITYYNFETPKYVFHGHSILGGRIEGDYLYFDEIKGVTKYKVEIRETGETSTVQQSLPIDLGKIFSELHKSSGEYNIRISGYHYDCPFTRYGDFKYTYVKRKEAISESKIKGNAAKIIGYKKPVTDPELENSKSQLNISFGGWQEKTEDPEEEWVTYDKELFKTGTYRYLVKVKVNPEDEEEYTLDENLKLTVDDTVFTKIEGGDEFIFASPEIEVDYPELTNVKFEEDVLSWDPIDDEDLWFYQINVGKYQKITSECSVDLKEICDALGYYGGIIPIELFAIAYEYQPITQIYSFDYEYDGPLPKDRTVINELTLQSSIKGMFREGYPNTNMLSAVDQFWIDCLEGWWEIYEDDEWSRYTEPTFGKGTYRYMNKISIDADYKDSYMLDPKLTLTVDKKEWSRWDTEYDINDEVRYIVFASPEYVLPLPEKAKITAISASCEDPSGYVKKGAEQAIPELTDIDREEVEIKTAWVLYENGEPKQPEGNTFTPGEWHLAAAILVKEDYEDTYELESTTTLTVNGEEWTNVTGKGDPHYGVFFISPAYVIEDAVPEIKGVSIEKGILTFDEFEGASRYSIIIGINRVFCAKTSYNLGRYIKMYGWPPEPYNIFITAVDKEYEPISQRYYIVYNYNPDEVDDDLPELTNAEISGDTLSWDTFPGAAYYRMHIEGHVYDLIMNFANLDRFCEISGIEPGVISVRITALDSNYEVISKSFDVTYAYAIQVDPENIEGGTWYTRWGATYYEKEDGELVTGKQRVEGETYFFDESGALQRNLFYSKEGTTNYFGSDGKMVTGWLERYIGTYYFDEEGVMQTGFVDIGEDTYYFNENGHQMKSIWVYEESKTYYIKADGKMAKSESIRRWGKKYSFDADGALMK